MIREFDSESSSHQTASSATQSGIDAIKRSHIADLFNIMLVQYRQRSGVLVPSDVRS
jgi:hypothetical protein